VRIYFKITDKRYVNVCIYTYGICMTE